MAGQNVLYIETQNINCMKRTVTFLLMALFVLLNSRAQDAFSQFTQRLTAFGKNIPQEKVFIQMENTSYFVGDTPTWEMSVFSA